VVVADGSATPVHRLSGRQLGWALHDLLGVDQAITDRLPLDQASRGLDVVSAGQRVDAPWASAASSAIASAVSLTFDGARAPRSLVPDPSEADAAEYAPEYNRTLAVYTLPRELTFSLDVPETGTWQLVNWAHQLMVRLDGDPFEDQEPTVSIFVDGTLLAVDVVTELDPMVRNFVHPVELTAGAHTVTVQIATGLTHFIAIASIDLEAEPTTGPRRRSEVLDRWIPCNPRLDASCVDASLATFLRFAWRRPVTPEEVTLLATLASDDPDPYEGLATAFQAALFDPSFLFQVEAPPTAAGRPLGGYELASRLAATLWESVPDEELLACAEANFQPETSPCGLRPTLERMLDDSRAARFWSALVEGWMSLDALTDPTFRGDEFDPAFAASMIGSARARVQGAAAANADIQELVLGSSVWLDPAMATFYGLDAPSSAGFTEVPSPEHSFGLHTDPAVLAAHSDSGRTSPTKRGKLILERFLCTSAGEPPPGVPSIASDVTTTEQVQDALLAHIQDPACASCHQFTDPVGLALEGYDAFGAWRGLPPAFEPRALPDGAMMSDEAALTAWIAADPRFPACVTTYLSTWFLQRDPSQADRRMIEDSLGGVPSADTGLADLLDAILRSGAFQTRYGDLEAP
jgi:hypothetical protein